MSRKNAGEPDSDCRNERTVRGRLDSSSVVLCFGVTLTRLRSRKKRDCCARLCTQSTAAGAQQVWGRPLLQSIERPADPVCAVIWAQRPV